MHTQQSWRTQHDQFRDKDREEVMATSTWFCFSGLGQVMGQKIKAGIVAIRGKDLTQENRETTFEMGGLSSLAWHGMLPPAWRSAESRTTRGNLLPAIRTQAQLAMPHKHRRLIVHPPRLESGLESAKVMPRSSLLEDRPRAIRSIGPCRHLNRRSARRGTFMVK